MLLLLLATKSYFLFLLVICDNLSYNVFAYNLIPMLFGNSPYNVAMENNFSWVMEKIGKNLYSNDKKSADGGLKNLMCELQIQEYH